MSNEAENKQNPAGSADPSGTKTDPSQRNQSSPPQDISKKNPSQESDSPNRGQEKPEDEKRRAS
jgi:hypothetical protein